MLSNTENTEQFFETEIIRDGITFVYICNSIDLKEGKGKRIEFKEDIDMQYAAFRLNNKLYCVSNICPHRHATRIFEGIIKGITVTCPLHGWTYSLETGENTNIKQGIKKLSKYQIFEENGKVFMEKPEVKIPKWREGFSISSGQNPIFE
jgi:nitrite reductase/ring-hydroxylating ferredoxin subunit